MNAHQNGNELMYDARMMRRRSSAHGLLPFSGTCLSWGEGGMAFHENNYVAEAAACAHEIAEDRAR
jgi:hypothetical protein